MKVGHSMGQAVPTLRYSVWMGPGQGQDMDTFLAQLRAKGNEIVEVDEVNQRALVARWNETQDRWGCILCFPHTIVIMDSEAELHAHCDHAHEGWRDVQA